MKGIKNIRLKEYDYISDGYYFVTICTNYRHSLLTGQTRTVVAQFIERISAKLEGVSVDYYVIMPSHVHIIIVLQGSAFRLGEVVRRLKAATSRKAGI